MGGSGGGGGDRDGGAARRSAAQRAELERQQKARAAQARFASRAQDERLGIRDVAPAPAASLATEKKREVGVRYTPVSTPSGGVETEATIMKTGPSGELARKPGVSPGDVMATVGTLPTVSADVAAANIAGRTDVNVATLGDLARRARVGNTILPSGSTAILSSIGRGQAMAKLTKLASDPQSQVVADPRGGIGDVRAGAASKAQTKAQTKPAERLDITPEVTPEVTGESTREETLEEIKETLVSITGGKTKRTKFKRFGGASDLAGQGVLVRKK